MTVALAPESARTVAWQCREVATRLSMPRPGHHLVLPGAGADVGAAIGELTQALAAVHRALGTSLDVAAERIGTVVEAGVQADRTSMVVR
ncbi:MAG: hypothetical protein JJT89_14545 [Nitriliruptoraceae bacterium]|nr:hypothetical protein [Nitriliruptoraceae bacterium]